MGRTAVLVAALALFCVASECEALAQYATAYDLTVECQGSKVEEELSKQFHQFTCAMYIAGLIDGLRVAGAYFHLPLPMCLPDEAFIIDQERLIYLKWATANPELLTASGRVSVMLAFNAAYPCKKPAPVK